MRALKYTALSVIVVAITIFSVPYLLEQYINAKYSRTPRTAEQFPVTVDPINKVIIENAEAEAYFKSEGLNYQALTLLSTSKLEEIFTKFAIAVSEILESSNLALVSNEKFVAINPGLRKEEVANAFARTLGWNNLNKKEFLSIAEGTFAPGMYAVTREMTVKQVQDLISERFANNVLSRYGTSTAEIVPLNTALTIASLIQRETIGTDDMRLVSGIIWNRIFKDMNLQLDATLQYTKANVKKNSVWWPEVRPQDKYIRSPFNTYLHSGLPPTPIASPSVAAIVAALNPQRTECLFYFHDKDGGFHCASTYKEHVTLLKQYYGRGK